MILLRHILCIIGLFCPAHAQTSTVSGTMKYPDGTLFNGRVTVQLTRSTVINTCTTPAQTVSFAPVTATIVAGNLAGQALYSTNCLSTGYSAPTTYAALSGAGTTPTISVGGNWYGTVSVTAGASPAPNAAIVKLGLTVPALLTCFMQPVGTNAVNAGATLVQQTVSRLQQTQVSLYMSLTSGSVPLTQSTTYVWSYSCVLPYAVSVSDTANRLMYTGKWIVPQTGTADISTVDFSQLVVVP